MQVPAVYWWYRTSSHAAELTSGYYNPTNQDGYAPVFDVLKRYSVIVKFVCPGMQISSQDNDEALADPESLSWQVRASFLLRLSFLLYRVLQASYNISQCLVNPGFSYYLKFARK